VLTTTADLAVAVVGPGMPAVCDAAPITTCKAGADAENDTGEDFTFAVPSGAANTGTYYVIVDSFSPFVEAAFSLTVTQM